VPLHVKKVIKKEESLYEITCNQELRNTILRRVSAIPKFTEMETVKKILEL